MGVCGNCPYPYEVMLENPELTEDNVCGTWCSHEDAAYRVQWAYNQLQIRYEELERKYNDFVNEMKMVYDLMIINQEEGLGI